MPDWLFYCFALWGMASFLKNTVKFFVKLVRIYDSLPEGEKENQ